MYGEGDDDDNDVYNLCTNDNDDDVVVDVAFQAGVVIMSIVK